MTGAILITNLERRLDNVIFRLCLASSRNDARQLVSHKHVLVNGKSLNIPSYQVQEGDKIEIREKSKKTEYFKNLDDISPAPSETPGWLKVDRKKVNVKVTGVPTREEAEPDINEQLIVEYYSR